MQATTLTLRGLAFQSPFLTNSMQSPQNRPVRRTSVTRPARSARARAARQRKVSDTLGFRKEVVRKQEGLTWCQSRGRDRLLGNHGRYIGRCRHTA